MLIGIETKRDGGLHSAEIWQHLEDRGLKNCVRRVTWFISLGSTHNYMEWQITGHGQKSHTVATSWVGQKKE
jgi:hypothetical protein